MDNSEIPVLRYNRTVGTRARSGAGNGKLEGTSEVPDTLENPCVNGKTRCGPKKKEARELCVKKSRYSYTVPVP